MPESQPGDTPESRVVSLYDNPRRYDQLAALLVAPGEDVAFFRRQAERFGGPVLELMCGSGRIAIPLAESALNITGVDLSKGMLDLARTKASRCDCAVNWVEQDIRGLALDRRFGLVFVAMNSIGHVVERADLEAMLARVRTHLLPDGRFIVDAFNPSLTVLTHDPDQMRTIAEFDDDDTGEHILLVERNRYDAATQVNRVEWRFVVEDGPPDAVDEVVCLDVRIYFPQELEALLAYNGFIVEAKFGGYDESPFQSGSEKQILICRAKDE